MLLDILSKMFFSDMNACSEVSWAAALVAAMLISQQPMIVCLFSRKYSRENRLTLLRAAAPPTLLDTVMPRRVLSNRPGQKIATKCLLWIFFPYLDKRIKSGRFKILSALAKKKRKRSRSYLTRCFSSVFCWRRDRLAYQWIWNKKLQHRCFIKLPVFEPFAVQVVSSAWKTMCPLNRQAASPFCSTTINYPPALFCWHSF